MIDRFFGVTWCCLVLLDVVFVVCVVDAVCAACAKQLLTNSKVLYTAVINDLPQ